MVSESSVSFHFPEVGSCRGGWPIPKGTPVIRRLTESEAAEMLTVPFSLEHYYELTARVNALVYNGRGREAQAYIAARWQPLQRSLIPLTVAADAWMTSEMIKSPARMTTMLAPGFGRLQ